MSAYLSSPDTRTPTSRQYSQMADYILMGATATSTTIPKVYPEVFAQSSVYAKPRTSSLDELYDDPNFDESTLQPITRSPYKKAKRTISRNDPTISSLPNMTDLWSAIDDVAAQPETWHSKRLLIQLRQQQYTILEALRPTAYQLFPSPKPFSATTLPWLTGIPLSSGDTALFTLTSPKHLESFIAHYLELSLYYATAYDSDIYVILRDFEAIVAEAHLTPIHRTILAYRIWGKTSAYIATHLHALYNTSYSAPYISNIFTKQICKKLAAAAQDYYDRKLYANVHEKWRKCRVCGERKLLTPYNFVRHSNKPGGFSLTCKQCEHAKKKGVSPNASI